MMKHGRKKWKLNRNTLTYDKQKWDKIIAIDIVKEREWVCTAPVVWGLKMIVIYDQSAQKSVQQQGVPTQKWFSTDVTRPAPH